MSRPNRMMKLVQTVRHLPDPVKSVVLSRIFGRIVPMVGTAGIRYDRVTPNEVVCYLPNKRPMQNHIKGVHAAAMALLAETATGFVTMLNVPDDRLIVIKSLQVNYRKIAQGSLTAKATLTDEQRQYIADNPKGNLLIPVTVTDEGGNQPIECEMVWAWLPRKKPAQA